MASLETAISNLRLHFTDLEFLNEYAPILVNFLNSQETKMPEVSTWNLAPIGLNYRRYENVIRNLSNLITLIDNPEITAEFEALKIISARKMTNYLLENIGEMGVDSLNMFTNKTVDNTENFSKIEELSVQAGEIYNSITNCHNVTDAENYLNEMKNLNFNVEKILRKMQYSFGIPEHCMGGRLDVPPSNCHPCEYLPSVDKVHVF
jgi:hypothetical protein